MANLEQRRFLKTWYWFKCYTWKWIFVGNETAATSIHTMSQKLTHCGEHRTVLTDGKKTNWLLKLPLLTYCYV